MHCTSIRDIVVPQVLSQSRHSVRIPFTGVDMGGLSVHQIRKSKVPDTWGKQKPVRCGHLRVIE